MSIAAGKLEVRSHGGLLLAAKYKSPQINDAIVMYVRVYQYSENCVRILLLERMSNIESSIDGKVENIIAYAANATLVDVTASLLSRVFK